MWRIRRRSRIWYLQAREREEICLEKERVESKMKPRLLAKGVGEIGCAFGRESEGLIILDVR